MKKNITAKILIAALLLIIIGAAFAVGKFFIWPRFIQKDPRTAVLEAAANMTGEIKKSETSLYSLYKDITSAQHSQDFKLGINGLSGNALDAIDPRVLSGLEMITLNDSAEYDPVNKKRRDGLTVNFAVTPLARLSLYTDTRQISLSAPQAFDYAVSVDPQRVTEEWDGSILGTYFGKIDGIILAGPFYEYYSRLLFPEIKPKKASLFDYFKYGSILDAGAEYVKVESSDGSQDVYRVTVAEEALNSLISALNEDFAPARFPDDYFGKTLNGMLDDFSSVKFTESVSLYVKVQKGRISEIAFDEIDSSDRIIFNGSLSDIVGSFKIEPFGFDFSVKSGLNNPDEFGLAGSLSVSEAGRPSTVSWDINWIPAETAEDNFKINVDAELNGGGVYSFAASGNLLANAESKIIDADLSKISVNTEVGEQTLEAELSLSLTLRPSTESILPADESKELTSVNELDLLGMYARIRQDPDIGPLITQYLP